MKIKQGDTVQVLSGKDKGKTGQVVHTFKETNQVVVEGVNVVTKHQRNRRSRSQGQIIEKPMPLDASKVAPVVDGKPVRVGYEFKGEGDKRTKIRVARPSGKAL